MSQPRFRKKPQGFQRLFLRMPIWLYKLHLGWLMGHRFLLLTHTGRKSGQTRQTVLEVIRYDPVKHTPTVVSGFGPKSDWYLNVRQTPDVRVRIGRDDFHAKAVLLSPDDAALEFQEYARNNPNAVKALASVLDYPWDGSKASCRAMAEALPVLSFRPVE